MDSKTSFCLIHGSAQNSSVWDLLTPEIRKRGYAVVTVDLPRDEPESAARYAEFVAGSLERIDEDSWWRIQPVGSCFRRWPSPLADGERERALRWGRELAAKMKPVFAS